MEGINLRGYKMMDLSAEKNGPDDVHYETVRQRVKTGKQVSVTFETGRKNKKETTVYLTMAMSEKIKKSFELYERYLRGEVIFKD